MNPIEVRRRMDTGLNYAVAVVPALLLVVAGYNRLSARLHSDDESDAGASMVEWVLITAFTVTVVAVIGVMIRQKLIDKTEEIDFTTPANAPAAG